MATRIACAGEAGAGLVRPRHRVETPPRALCFANCGSCQAAPTPGNIGTPPCARLGRRAREAPEAVDGVLEALVELRRPPDALLAAAAVRLAHRGRWWCGTRRLARARVVHARRRLELVAAICAAKHGRARRLSEPLSGTGGGIKGANPKLDGSSGHGILHMRVSDCQQSKPGMCGRSRTCFELACSRSPDLLPRVPARYRPARSAPPVRRRAHKLRRRCRAGRTTGPCTRVPPVRREPAQGERRPATARHGGDAASFPTSLSRARLYHAPNPG